MYANFRNIFSLKMVKYVIVDCYISLEVKSPRNVTSLQITLLPIFPSYKKFKTSAKVTLITLFFGNTKKNVKPFNSSDSETDKYVQLINAII